MKTTADPPRPDDRLGDIVARLGSAQKSNKGAGAYARWINRRLGRYLAAFAFTKGWTPNQITAVSAGFTFGGIAAIALLRPTWWLGIMIAVTLATGYALDAADGQLARLRGGGSAAGEWLDHVVDAFKISSIHVAVLVCWYRFYELPDERYMLIPIVFGLQATVFYFAIMLTEQLRRSSVGLLPSSAPVQHEASPVLRSLLVVPNDFGLLCWSFSLLRFERAFISVYGALMAINVLFLIVACVRWYSEMRALGPHRR